jgi:hypothetical protein
MRGKADVMQSLVSMSAARLCWIGPAENRPILLGRERDLTHLAETVKLLNRCYYLQRYQISNHILIKQHANDPVEP